MPFSGGIYSLPVGQPVITNTTILASTFNTLTGDIKNAFNLCLTRDGATVPSLPMKFVDGTAVAPGITFNAESSTGIWRPSGSGVLAFAVSGNETMRSLANTALLINKTTDDGTNKLQVNGGISSSTITTSGAVGIGGTANAAYLDVFGNHGTYPVTTAMIRINNSSATGQSAIDFKTNGSLVNRIRSDYAGGMAYVATGAGAHSFWTGGDSGTGTSICTIQGSGLSATSLASPTLNTTTQINAQGNQTTAIATATTGAGGIMVQGASGQAAYMSFHRPGSYATYFGLDTDNQFKFGGWSAGAVAQTFLHTGNYNSYAPTLGGSGASGTWGINITGGASTASTVVNNGGRTDGTPYPVLWAPGGSTTQQPTFSCNAVTITSSTGQLSATSLTAGTQLSTTAGDITANRGGSGVIFLGTGGAYVYFNGSSYSMPTYSLTVGGDITAFSDKRVKTDFEPIENALAKVNKLRGLTYRRTDNGSDKREAGLIAQDVEKVLPEAVGEAVQDEANASKKRKVKRKTLAYNQVIALLVEAVKELTDKVEALEAK